MTTNEQLLEQIERAIRAGRVVTVGDQTIRWCKRDQEFVDDEGNVVRALASGVFKQMKVYEAPDFTKPVGFRWVHVLPIDDLDLVLKDTLGTLSPQARDVLSLELAFTAGLMATRAEEKHRRRRVATDVEETSIEFTPDI